MNKTIIGVDMGATKIQVETHFLEPGRCIMMRTQIYRSKITVFFAAQDMLRQ